MVKAKTTHAGQPTKATSTTTYIVAHQTACMAKIFIDKL